MTRAHPNVISSVKLPAVISIVNNRRALNGDNTPSVSTGTNDSPDTDWYAIVADPENFTSRVRSPSSSHSVSSSPRITRSDP